MSEPHTYGENEKLSYMCIIYIYIYIYIYIWCVHSPSMCEQVGQA